MSWRDFLRSNGLAYDETLRNGEDFHLIAALLATGGALWVIPEAGYFYTTRTGSVSNRLNPDHARIPRGNRRHVQRIQSRHPHV